MGIYEWTFRAFMNGQFAGSCMGVWGITGVWGIQWVQEWEFYGYMNER